MQLRDKHTPDKPVSASLLFKGEEGTSATALQILKGQQLKEHLTRVPAMLVCISGKVIFENENGLKESLSSGDYIHIEPMVKHWVDGLEDSQLIVIK
jgi:quercetin dioxygenase-like cupin family protein